MAPVNAPFSCPKSSLSSRPVGIAAQQWAVIHGAIIVFIRRMNLGKDSIRRVGRYFALQCLSDQRGALVRMSWSWKRSRFAISKAWAFMLKAYKARSTSSTWCGINPGLVDISFSDFLAAWENLLSRGWCVLGSTIFVSKDREVIELFAPVLAKKNA